MRRLFALDVLACPRCGEPRPSLHGTPLYAERKHMDAAHRAYRGARGLVERVKEGVRNPQLRAGLEQALAIHQIYELSD